MDKKRPVIPGVFLARTLKGDEQRVKAPPRNGLLTSDPLRPDMSVRRYHRLRQCVVKHSVRACRFESRQCNQFVKICDKRHKIICIILKSVYLQALAGVLRQFPGVSMHIISRLTAMLRGYQLGRELKVIDQTIISLPGAVRMKLEALIKVEMDRASKCQFPHLYGTSPAQRYVLWGQGTEIGYTRATSTTQEVQIRGIAMWFAVAFYETVDSAHQNLQPLHRQLLRILRELKQSSFQQTSAQRWMKSTAA
jgi:hypothetical protein